QRAFAGLDLADHRDRWFKRPDLIQHPVNRLFDESQREIVEFLDRLLKIRQARPIAVQFPEPLAVLQPDVTLRHEGLSTLVRTCRIQKSVLPEARKPDPEPPVVRRPWRKICGRTRMPVPAAGPDRLIPENLSPDSAWRRRLHDATGIAPARGSTDARTD